MGALGAPLLKAATQIVSGFLGRSFEVEPTTSIMTQPLKSGGGIRGRNLVDPASSHMLVLKIKPCMSKYKSYTVKLRMAH